MYDRAGARLDAVRRVADGVDPRLDPPGWCDYAGWIQCVVADLPANARLVEVGVWCGLSARHWARAIRATGRPMTIDVIDDWRGLTDAYAGPQADAVRRHIASHGSLEASTRALLAADADIVSVRTGSSLALKFISEQRIWMPVKRKMPNIYLKFSKKTIWKLPYMVRSWI